MRARSALRRASRSPSESVLRVERRAMLGSLGDRGPPGWRAAPAPPARPPGRATIRVASRPASGRRRLRQLVDVAVGLAVDRLVGGRDGLRLSVLLLARLRLGLVVGD